MKETYKVLTKSPAIFKVLAWIGLAMGLLSSVVMIAGMDQSGAPRWMGIVTLIGGAIYFFVFFVIAEALSLLLDMSERIK